MQLNYNTEAPKRPVNLTANNELVSLVRSEKGNLSKLFEESIDCVSFRTRAHTLEEREQSGF